MVSRLLFVGFCVLVSATPAFAQIKLAVTEIKARRGVDPVLAHVVEEFLASEIAKTGRYEVIGRDDITRMLDHEQQKQMTGCEEESCMAEIAGAMGVDYLAAGSLDGVGRSVMITLKLINVRAARVESRETELLRGATEEDALDGVVALVRRLFPAPETSLTGREMGMWGSAAGAAAFAITGAVVLGLGYQDIYDARDLVDRSATEDIRYSQVTTLEDSGHSKQITGGVFLGLGVAAAATSLVLYLLDEDPSTTRISGFSSMEKGNVVGLQGRF